MDSNTLNLKLVKRSQRIGKRRSRFPSRADYLQYLIGKGAIASASDLNQDPELVARIQQHWHGSGQNGCRFARLLSRAPDGHGWHIVVVTRGNEKSWLRSVMPKVHRHIMNAIRHPGTNALSLIFPGITRPHELIDLLAELDRTTKCRVEEVRAPVAIQGRQYVPVGLRVLLNEEGVRSWALGFGPFSFLPPTRRAPFTELALATKPVSKARTKGLNQNKLLAHLADVRAPVDREEFDRLMSQTKRSRADILNGEYDDLAKARVTFLLPRKRWDAVAWQ